MKSTPTRRYEMKVRAESAKATADVVLEAARVALFQKYYDEIKLADIAATAGVTVQTVLRRFGSKEGLFEAVCASMTERIGKMTEVRVGDADAALRRTLKRYEWMGDANYRLSVQEDRVPPIARACQASRVGHRAWIEEAFAPYLPRRGAARERRVLQLLLILDVYAWRLMRREHGASARQTEDALSEMLDALLAVARKDEIR